MAKAALIQALKEFKGLSKSEADKTVELFFNTMPDVLTNGDRVEMRGLCSFQVKEYESYTGRNPKTGEYVIVRGKKLPFFKVGTGLKRRVDKIET